MLLQNMYQNPVINAPLGPDGYPVKVDERKAQQEFEVGSRMGAMHYTWKLLGMWSKVCIFGQGDRAHILCPAIPLVVWAWNVVCNFGLLP